MNQLVEVFIKKFQQPNISDKSKSKHFQAIAIYKRIRINNSKKNQVNGFYTFT